MTTSETTHVLIADITGSTPLYEKLSEGEALAQISYVLDEMRRIIAAHDGECVSSKGDDTLSIFTAASDAFAAARAMVETEWAHGMAIHAGAYRGDVIRHGADIYGDAVNTAARLSSLAKPSEVLLGDTVVEGLDDRTKAILVGMGGLRLKGKGAPVQVHSFAVSDMDTQTVLFGAKESVQAGRRTASVALQAMGNEWSLQDGENLTIGRSPDCDVVLQHPWVSRKHGSLELRAAQLEYTDHSSSGSVVITADGQEFSLQRRSMLLNGVGMILVGTQDKSQDLSIIRYATNDLVPELPS